MIESGTLKLTTLCENAVSRGGVRGEWGLSILIEAADRKILFDTGGGLSVAQNAFDLGMDLSAIDAIVISHSHWDHTGGLPPVLKRIKGGVPVYAHPGISGQQYSYSKKHDTYRFSGMPYRMEYLESLGARFSLSKEPQWITEDICTSGEEAIVTGFEEIPDTFYAKVDGEYVRDTVADDLSLFIRTDLGLVVVLGCAHRGIINILKHARKVTGIDSIYMAVGGTHLYSADDNRLEKTIDALREIDPVRVGVSHCTGFKASAAIASAFPDKFFTNNTGTVIEFPYE